MTDLVAARTDEQKIARALTVGIPVLTVSGAIVVGVIYGAATAILVLAAGVLLGVIALLWGSLRILSGDAMLSPELEALDMATQGVDALASRKRMLLRALKDLESERGIGKLEDDDFDQIALVYRTELKAVMRRMDEALEPHRARAEAAARSYLAKAGLAEQGYRGEQPLDDAKPSPKSDPKPTTSSGARARVECPNCNASNEPDAKFCKECATNLKLSIRTKAAEDTAKAAKAATEQKVTDDSSDDSSDAP